MKWSAHRKVRVKLNVNLNTALVPRRYESETLQNWVLQKNGIVLIFSSSELKNNNKKQHATGRKGAATTNKDD